jgi:hypothetical protein
MDGDLLTKQSWGCGLLVAGLQILGVVLICYIRLVLEMFRRREYLIGVLFSVLFLFIGGGWVLGVLTGLPVGWRNARRWDIRAWMVVWTLALVGGLANIAVGGLLLKMPIAEWREWFAWVPPF